ncbi:CPBP family intramembrane metalloprotease [Tenacibaculum aiptasiae]|uniref:CPBP family intramembrane metalloprotease n=1 Tax=Tenacibaculum aiptasiae TaxID=426481 RepID=A0A7J5AR16_9FLAO|nr:CPBP family intramembrane glutamic endopeptidase [Tenacibaculum aiptasiae]KAB1159403.1 CPBP family intramembrane metalloprotease [Tenacibaculum aiptasiae]
MTSFIKQNNQLSYFLDLIVYLAIMFLIREIHIPNTHFLVNTFLYSGTTFIVATWQMNRRGVTWSSIGLKRPKSIFITLLKAVFLFLVIIATFLIFKFIQESFSLVKENPTRGIKTGKSLSNGDYGYVFSIIIFIWLQSALEELLERAFLITWLERLFEKTSFKTTLAIIIQACIWGFRHSYDISDRSLSVALVGIIMGIAYVKFHRNLWTLIIAHCAMNTMSLI